MLKTIITALLLAFTASSAQATNIKGDLNRDGETTVTDVTILVDFILGHPNENMDLDAADMNGDGDISVSDVTLLVDIILGIGQPGSETGGFSDDPAIGPAQAQRGR